MHNLVRQLVPPMLVDIWRTNSAPIFPSYDAAYAACRNGAYEEEALVKVVVEKNLAFRRAIQSAPVFDLAAVRTLIGVGLANTGSTLRVLDFGGGGGYHYSLARAVLGRDKRLSWNIVETSAMTKEGQRIATPELKFFDNIHEARGDLGSVDLVLTSGALQYCPDPIKFLKALADLRAKNIFITRTPLSDSAESLVSVQASRLSENGPGPLPPGFDDKRIAYPITLISRRAVERVLTEKYRIVFSIQEDKNAFSAGNKTFDMYGYYCELKEPAEL